MNNLEIERKWLTVGFPDLPVRSEELQEQGYLAFEPATVRIRKVTHLADANAKTDEYWLTIKGGGTLSRTEVELPLDAAQYTALLPLVAAPIATKRLRRHTLPGGQELECSLVDEGEPDAFCYAEVEFESEEAAAAFVPPSGLGREVTGEPGFTMAAHCRRKLDESRPRP